MVVGKVVVLVPSFSGEGFVCVSGFWGATRAQRFKPVVGLFLFFFFLSLQFDLFALSLVAIFTPHYLLSFIAL